jgi:hypothetical protein
MSTVKEKSALEKADIQRKQKLANVMIGQLDFAGRKIHDVYVTSDDYRIYSIGPLGSIKGIKLLFEARNDTPIINFQLIKSDFDKLKAISFKSTNPLHGGRVAQALSSAIHGKTSEAITTLSEIHREIEEEYIERVIGKLIYLSGTYLVAFILCSLGLFLYVYQPDFFVKRLPALYELVLVCSLATLGGIISVSKNINTISVDRGLGKLPYFVHGIERNIFSVVGGIFIYLLIKSNLLFGFVSDLDNQLYGISVFGFLAGFSETLIPNALKNLEDRVNKESDN